MIHFCSIFRYKIVELFFYLAMGFSPALVVTSMVRNANIDVTNTSFPFMTSLSSGAALLLLRKSEF